MIQLENTETKDFMIEHLVKIFAYKPNLQYTLYTVYL